MSWTTNWNKSNKRAYSWKYIDRACKSLAETLIESSDPPVRIVAMSRGGLPPATILANYLDIREIVSVGVRSYESKPDGTHHIYEPVVYQDAWRSAPGLSNGDTVLVVDDISDKGATFKYVLDKLDSNISRATNLITTSIFIKDRTSYIPDYYYKKVPDDQWVEFPWEHKKLTTAPQAPARAPLTMADTP